MAETTRKGVWDLQQVRDQILDNVWEQQFELFSWGDNSSGKLGQNTTTSVSSPVQIPGTSWSSISGGNQHSLATKTDNTLWAWGRNHFGQLGQNTTTMFITSSNTRNHME
jgi:alpha-tubulin suppressor-like RCC1 family protein